MSATVMASMIMQTHGFVFGRSSFSSRSFSFNASGVLGAGRNALFSPGGSCKKMREPT